MAEPNYADTPWWSNLLAVLLTAIVSVLGTLYAMRPATPGGPSQPPVILSFFKDTITYIPHILLLFGILADMFTYEGVYSIPSLIGLLSIPANWLMQFFWTGILGVYNQLAGIIATQPAVPVPIARGTQVGGGGVGEFFRDYDGCDVQGFSGLRSAYAPQTLVVTATILAYYIFDLIQNRGLKNATATIVLGIVLYAAQTFVVGSCAANATEPGTALKSLAALAEGLLFGGIGFATVQYVDPARLPSSAISPFPKVSRSDLKPGPGGTLTDTNGNPYVCMPNGQCFPDLSTAESKKAFADIAAKSFGSGSPAVPADCPATTS
jgi:hypothetical protein